MKRNRLFSIAKSVTMLLIAVSINQYALKQNLTKIQLTTYVVMAILITFLNLGETKW